MLQRLGIAIPTLIIAGFIGCSPAGIVLRAPPAWIEHRPVLPGYFIATGTQTGGENAGELAAQHAREDLSQELQPRILVWMENYVVKQVGLITDKQAFYLKQLLPAMMDKIMLNTEVEDSYSRGKTTYVLLKLDRKLARKLVNDRLSSDRELPLKIKSP